MTLLIFSFSNSMDCVISDDERKDARLTKFSKSRRDYCYPLQIKKSYLLGVTEDK